MNRSQLSLAVEKHVQTMLDNDAISDGDFIHIFLDDRFRFVFCFNAWMDDDGYKAYEVMCDSANTFAEQDINKLYPNITAYLKPLVERIFAAQSKENQTIYFESLTGRALRNQIQENDN